MDDRDNQLMRCFAAAFPAATREDIRAAGKFDAIPGSDSLQLVNLLAVLDDAFGVQVDLPEVLDLQPFDGIKQYLLQRGLLA
jgi:acyl carrier protein